MLDEAVYDRQHRLDLQEIPEAIVVGLGGTGFWTALFAAMSGCPALHLMDSDHIDATNLNRLPLATNDIGKGKTAVVKETIERLRPDCVIQTYGKAGALSLDSLAGEPQLMFDCTDNAETQRFLHAWCKRRAVRYVRVGYDGTHFTVTEGCPWSIGPATTGYDIFPSWVVPAVIAAALGVSKIMHKNVDVSMDVGEIGGKNEQEKPPTG